MVNSARSSKSCPAPLPKSAREPSLRHRRHDDPGYVALPSFTSEAIRCRLSVTADRSSEAMPFRSGEGTPLTTANVRHQLRKVLSHAGIEGVHPHMLRRTIATVVNEQASVNLAAELLGHTDPKVTIEHYIRHNEHVNPLTAERLDMPFAPDTPEEGAEPTVNDFLCESLRPVGRGRPDTE